MTNPDSATRILRDQHVKILQVADVLEELLAFDPSAWDYEAIADCVRFIRLFADALHHGKEEDLLFPALEGVGFSRTMGPLAVMLHEHEQGRAFARTMTDVLPAAQAGDDEARTRFMRAGHGYIDLIRGHIGKENNVLFNMADQMLDAPTCQSLCGAYDGVCERRFEGCTVSELEQILERLVARTQEL